MATLIFFIKTIKPYQISLLSLGLLFFLPFSLNIRFAPNLAFFLESIAIFLALIIFLGVACSGSLPRRKPKIIYYFITLMVLWLIQLWFIPTVYIDFYWIIWAVFLVLILLAWALSGLVSIYGLPRILRVIAYALVFATLWQILVCWVQFFDLTRFFHGLIMINPEKYYVYGQLGQRNHLGHLVFWGLMASTYLLLTKKINVYYGWIITLLIAVSLGLIGSRTIILYIFTLAIVVCSWWIKNGYSVRKTAILLLAVLIISFLSQLLLVNFLTLFDSNIALQNGLVRVGQSASDEYRVFEWYKSWQLILQHPYFGVGWQAYAYQGFLQNRFFAFNEIPHLGALFTHSHNSILQIFTEMGFVGGVLILGGLLWNIRYLFLLKKSIHYLMITTLLVISICHSLLEYPLWYLYFLLPFSVLVILVSLNQEEKEYSYVHAPKWQTSLGILMGIGLIAILFYQILIYAQFIQIFRQVDTHKQEKIIRLIKLNQNPYILHYYIESKIIGFYPLSYTKQTDILDGIVKRTTLFRPFNHNAQQWGLQLWRNQQYQQANEWLDIVWQYYPQLILKNKNQILFDKKIPETVKTEFIRNCILIKGNQKECMP